MTCNVVLWHIKRTLGKNLGNLNQLCTLMIMYQYWFNSYNKDTNYTNVRLMLVILMLVIGETEYRVYGNSMCWLLSSSRNHLECPKKIVFKKGSIFVS